MHSDSETARLTAQGATDPQEGETFKDWQTSLTCLILDVHGHYNGYVQIPVGHIFYQKGYVQCVKPNCTEKDTYELELSPGYTIHIDHCHTAERMLQVHGGVTFSGELHTVDNRYEGWWLGFDTNHFGDAGTVSKDFQHVLTETLKLAAQLV